MRIKTVALLSLVLIFALSASTWSQGQNPTSSGGSAADAQGVGSYLLGPGDVLDVRVFAQPDLNSVVEIDGDGNISTLPFLEAPIKAQCRTDREIQRDITTAYGKYIRNPQVSVRITERKSRQPATIAGAVRTEMQVVMMRRARLHELITRAGGTTDRASGTIQIMHTVPQMCPDPIVTVQKTAATDKAATDNNASEFGIAIYKLADLRAGKEEADPYVWPGDIVLVNEAEPVYVIGAVVGPREIPLRDGVTLARAIAMAGGAQRMAKDEVAIYRQKPGLVGQETLKFNYSAIKKGKEPDVPLKAYDIIDVGMSGPLSGKGLADLFTNTLRGAVPGIATRGIIY
jgi:polysaccharide export outer membrane protein